MPERQWSMFACPECDSLASMPGNCLNLSHQAHTGPMPVCVPIEVVPRSQLDAAREALGNACGHIESMAQSNGKDFAAMVAERYRREGGLTQPAGGDSDA